MKRCRCCDAPIAFNEGSYRGSETSEPGDPALYLLHFICLECTAGLTVILFDADPPDHEQLLDDVAPLMSAARDNRERDGEDEQDAA